MSPNQESGCRAIQLQDGTCAGRRADIEPAAETGGAAAQAGEAGAVRVMVGRVEAPAIVANFGMQLPVHVAHEKIDPTSAAVLERIGQCLLQEAQQV